MFVTVTVGFGNEAVGERKAFGFEAAKERFDPGVIITVALSAQERVARIPPQIAAAFAMTPEPRLNDVAS